MGIRKISGGRNKAENRENKKFHKKTVYTMTRKRNKTYKFIEKLIDKVTTSESNNMNFTPKKVFTEL